MHLKVIRAYIDGVLRFGIPPKFFMGIIKPVKGNEDKIRRGLTEIFADPAMKDMYGTKEELNDVEDFFPYVVVQLSSPSFLM